MHEEVQVRLHCMLLLVCTHAGTCRHIDKYLLRDVNVTRTRSNTTRTHEFCSKNSGCTIHCSLVGIRETGTVKSNN